MNTLNKVKEVADKSHIADDDDGADDYDFWQNLDVTKLKRYELRNYLAARDLSTEGKKKELIHRLQDSIEKDRLEEQAYVDELEAEFRRNADLEELGSVYAIGCNGSGQLGLGDLEPRENLKCILSLRGLNVQKVVVGADSAFAITQDHDVYGWGGSGVGPMAMKLSLEEISEGFWLEPTFVQSLKGEDVMQLSMGASHGVAISDAGDCYAWGFGSTGQLGLGDFEHHPVPQIVEKLQATKMIIQAAAGQSHTIVVTSEHQVYAWGHGADGRLGLGATERIGVTQPLNKFFPSPCLIAGLAKEFVRSVCCGPNHTLALTNSGVFSWGCGSGGRLGHGDMLDRHSPGRVVALDNKIVLEIQCGVWHCGAIILFPPLQNGGYVYTWGSGFHGQLAQREKQCIMAPKAVSILSEMHVWAKSLSLGSHHCAIITADDELYTWGSNKHNCLARKIQLWEIQGLEQNPHLEEPEDDSEYDSDSSVEELELDIPQYTPVPGHVAGFGTIVERTGRGLPLCVACGHEFTLIVTQPYEGPTEETAKEIIEEEDLRLEERAVRERQLARRRRNELAKQNAMQKRKGQVVAIEVMRCDIDESCPGFDPHVFKPNVCKECGFNKNQHNTPILRSGDSEAHTSSDAMIA